MDSTLLIQGLMIGSIYALAGVSINIIYRPTNIFNLAQGNLVMLGAIVCSSLLGKFGLPWYLAALISLALAFVATLYPSWRASRVKPAEALRYE